MKHKFYIDSHKALTGVFILGLIAYYSDWDNLRAWIYLSLHGTYGLLWITKSRFFGDKQWDRPVSVGAGVGTWVGLSLYWISPWLITSHRSAEPPAWWLGMCISMYVIGVFLHFTADMQKYVSLQIRPGVLITEGLWSRVRNPNYLGELLIYLGFSLVAFHWVPIAVLATLIAVGWVPLMKRKDVSLSRYTEFAAYKQRSGLIIPYLL